MSDPILPHSPSISAYMSVHEVATNLAYVRYFGQVDQATKATFKSLNARQFTLDYTLSDGTTGQVSIPFKTPLTDRQEVRPVLESMAKEAEDALGLPSSLSGPPPFKAIAKAMMATAYTPENPTVPLDSFYMPRPIPMLMIGFGMGATALFAYASDDYLKRQFPIQIFELRKMIGQSLSRRVMDSILVIHVVECAYALATCLRRGWYGPVNTIKWVVSTFIFGIGSMRQLKQHAKDVYNTI
ncbi:hypothetical protein G6F46_008262 [Rhizopus delemar]|uniref:DUF2470 domain-containing protein n=2 Tax=Rhizopus TaxID=4842 RepID=A0A9P6YZB9_9FUNG|nr:hypothetical protein G6F55_007194 [Rhizopus delemar]KAG1540401.1 hypothetical protein G6F51_008548 [Rhizopus arrhizus]KAG1494591.1 hypothetical protein G6F54_007772 [Rhizopus delemar]KAG1508641.1 hypothetical protein G6F53_008041 [Rhizopus delemar]KAG1520929.1 hypothetical protein G6F52_007206 [Rhizopus delemar]